MDDEQINLNDLTRARHKEIKSIEESISKTNKKSLLWQRVPFYQRRRNRCFDKRTLKKKTPRKKDRHFLRTHTFFSKRFFMIKIKTLNEKFSFPLKRRLKSDKFIYKSQKRGFLFDESFRKIELYNLEDHNNYKDINDGINYINNEYELIKYDNFLICIGKSLYKDKNLLKNQNFKESFCSLSLIKSENIDINKINNDINNITENSINNIFKNVKFLIFKSKNKNSIENYKIICKRNFLMNIFQILINNGMIPISYDEINRIALENNKITIFDNINSDLFKKIEFSKNEKIIEKYNKTPKSKRVEYDFMKLKISQEPDKKCFYYIFKCIKGVPKEKAEVFDDENLIGRIIRCKYKFSSGKMFGLLFLFKKYENNTIFCKNLENKVYYDIEILNEVFYI